MRSSSIGRRICLVAAIGLAGPSAARAVESTFMLYSLGSGAVGAGQMAPEGIYFTTIGVYSEFNKSVEITFGGTALTAKAYLPAAIGSAMFVAPTDVLGGRVAFTVTSGFGNLLVDASTVGGVNRDRSTRGWGGTDTSIQSSIGWDINANLSHKLSVTQWIPVGRYDDGFNPNIGLNRYGADVSWGVTAIEPNNKIELSGTAGFTLEGYNPATAYRSGNSVHLEEGLFKHFDNGLRLGAVSYQYDQLCPDGGAGARLGAFRTRAVGVGPSAGYTTEIGGHMVIFGAQATREIADANRLRQTGGQLTTTVKF